MSHSNIIIKLIKFFLFWYKVEHKVKEIYTKKKKQITVCIKAKNTLTKKNSNTWPPDKSNTANFPSEIAFKPIFHHRSLSSSVRSSTVDTLLSGTGSIAAAGKPEISNRIMWFTVKDHWNCSANIKFTEREILTVRLKRTSNDPIDPWKIQTLKKSSSNYNQKKKKCYIYI